MSNHEIITPEDLRAHALRAAADQTAAEEEGRVADRARRRLELMHMIQRELGFDINLPANEDQLQLAMTDGEMVALMAAQDYLLAYRICPDCQEVFHSAPIRNLADLGRALNGEAYNWHWCKAKQPEQSAADRLVEALRAVIEGVSI